MYLEGINSPQDVKKLDFEQLKVLADEIREYIVSVVSSTGGHLAPNLGVTELTLALHYVFDMPKDKILWDVGHQAYVHKIITGRRERLKTNRQYKGVAGFPLRSESPFDVFGTAHSSTTISAALGFAVARDYKAEENSVVAVVGDGAMTAGLALEGINNAGSLRRNLIVILNDNRMSISPNVGALNNYFTDIASGDTFNKLKDEIWKLTEKLPAKGKIVKKIITRLEDGFFATMGPGVIFEKLGFRYLGPINGHDIEHLVKVLTQIKKMKGPVFLHVVTTKGKGYKFAEDNARKFHGVNPFDPDSGASPQKKGAPPSYTEVFGKTICELAERDPKIVGITAAMCDGTGLTKFAEKFPDRYFDVGIAEQHAVEFSAGLAVEGMKPFACIYSTFLQRAYDQVIHDVVAQDLPVRFCIDRAGLVGDDGRTMQGVFDIGFLRMLPNTVIMSPRDEQELRDMLYTMSRYEKGPIVCRYPRGNGIGIDLRNEFTEIPIGKSVTLKRGSHIAIIGLGWIVQNCLKASELLESEGIFAEVVDARFVKPLDSDMLRDLANRFDKIVTVEDSQIANGFGSAVLEFLNEHRIHNIDLLRLGIPDMLVEHGKRELLYEKVLNLHPEGIAKSIFEFTRGEKSPPVLFERITTH